MGILDTISNALSGKVAQTPTGEPNAGSGQPGINKLGDTEDMTKLRAAKEQMMKEKGLDFNGNPLPKSTKKQLTDKKKKPTYQRLYKDSK